MVDFATVKNLIISQLPDAEVEVTDLTGTQDHLGIEVKSSEFKGKRLLQQHRLIMDILKEKLKEEIHAVQIKTIVKE